MLPFLRKLVGIVAAFVSLMSVKTYADGAASSSVLISWNPSPSPTTVGYFVCVGTNSGVYFQKNAVPATQPYYALTLPNGLAYYIAVEAFDSSSNVSSFSNEIEYTNSLVVSSPGQGGGTNGGVGLPPMPTNGPSTNPPVVTSTNSGSGGSSSNALASIWGIPPMLALTVSNMAPVLNIAGTVGATMTIECTTNPRALYNWEIVTNVQLTNVADIATNGVSNPDALDLAFVPSQQQFQVPATETNALFFRTVMPYDYIVLAGQVLPQKGYPSRLIMVTMPGLADDACYVTPESSYIHYRPASNTFELCGSGPTIRQIADTLAGSLNQSWTTASEFIYTNGAGQILATVVKTEDPSTDPVAGNVPSSPIVINF